MTAQIPTMDCPQARLSLGVYVLGAIDPGDRAIVEGHLATCRDCRDELAGLAGLPALLARVSREEAMALAATDLTPPADFGALMHGYREPPRELLGAVLDLAAARRRRRGWREVGLGIAAALIIVAGVLGGLRLGAGPAGSPVPVAQNNPGPASGPWQTVTTSSRGMSAAISYRPMGWGTQLAVKVTGIAAGTRCQLVVVGPDGSRTLAGSWETDSHEGTVWYPASASVAGKDVRGFRITIGASRSLTLTT